MLRCVGFAPVRAASASRVMVGTRMASSLGASGSPSCATPLRRREQQDLSDAIG